MNSFRLFIVAIISITVATSCTTQPLSYSLDPDFSQVESLIAKDKIIYVDIIDERTQVKSKSPANQINEQQGQISELNKKFRSVLKASGYKLISKPLLADFAVEIKVLALSTSLKENTFKSIIEAKSQIQMTLSQQSRSKSKIFENARKQEVANPVNELDITGVVNQVLSSQLTQAFNDKDFIEFIGYSE